ncbi:TPA: hypothetical protein I7730_16050 [Vibrio vulnificus]|uniref:Uncharacterized protein n=1 Tax=Vibrio vulnificus TaxID=672 RepID=A0A8H9N1V5_VIBVL|nr:hypothetical protein [Vibrio vulnificus]
MEITVELWKQINEQIESASRYEECNGSSPSVFIYKNLDGKMVAGFNYQPTGTELGHRFNIDHGVGIHRNEDGMVVWIKSPVANTQDELSITFKITPAMKLFALVEAKTDRCVPYRNAKEIDAIVTEFIETHGYQALKERDIEGVMGYSLSEIVPHFTRAVAELCEILPEEFQQGFAWTFREGESKHMGVLNNDGNCTYRAA